MIRGTVNSRIEAVVPLRVRGPSGPELDVEATIDTGFTGFLTLPPAIISALHLPLRAQVDIQLGDGTMRQFNTYDVEVEWDGIWRALIASEIDIPSLLGLGLLARHEAFIKFVPGGVVDITAIP